MYYSRTGVKGSRANTNAYVMPAFTARVCVPATDADGPETTKPERARARACESPERNAKRVLTGARFKRRINSILMFRAIPQTEARVGDSF